MKFMIIAAKFGSGHLSVSESIKKQGSKDDIFDIIVSSSFKFEKPTTKLSLFVFNNVVSKYTKDGLVKATYDVSYRIARNHKILYFTQKNDGSKRTSYLLKKEQPDAIIETFPHLIKNTYGALRCCVITDYTFAKVYIAENEDGAIYCVPSPSVKEEAVSKFGLNPDDIFVTGIPVRDEFNQVNNKTSCKKILITLGARGQISKKDVDKLIDISLDNNLEVKVVCGKNEKIYNHLKDREDIEVYGYINNMYELYKEVDLVITKSGGISVSECICSEIPMIINIDQSMSGQEKNNQQYIMEQGIGICRKMKNMDEAIIKFATDDAFYQEVRDNLKQAKKENYQHRVLDVIKERVKEKELA